MTGHVMRVYISPGGVDLVPQCNEPDGAMCRVTCPVGCGSWEEGHEHDLKPLGYCSAVEWFEADDVAGSYGGDEERPLFDGMAIRVWYDSDHCYWEVP